MPPDPGPGIGPGPRRRLAGRLGPDRPRGVLRRPPRRARPRRRGMPPPTPRRHLATRARRPRGGAVRLDGRPVEGPTDLPFGTTFVVGEQRITLQPSSTSSPWTDRPLPSPVTESVNESAGFELATRHRNDWESQGDAHDRRGRAQRETKRWEARWRAAGERLRGPPSGRQSPPRRGPKCRPSRGGPSCGGRTSAPRRSRPPCRPSRLRSPPPRTRPGTSRPPRRTRDGNRSGHRPGPRHPAPHAPGPHDPVRLSRPEPPARSRKDEPSGPVAPAVESSELEAIDSPTLLKGLGISRIEHDDLDALISRLQSPLERPETPAEVADQDPETGGPPFASGWTQSVPEPPPLAQVPEMESVAVVDEVGGPEESGTGVDAHPTREDESSRCNLVGSAPRTEFDPGPDLGPRSGPYEDNPVVDVPTPVTAVFSEFGSGPIDVDIDEGDDERVEPRDAPTGPRGDAAGCEDRTARTGGGMGAGGGRPGGRGEDRAGYLPGRGDAVGCAPAEGVRRPAAATGSPNRTRAPSAGRTRSRS